MRGVCGAECAGRAGRSVGRGGAVMWVSWVAAALCAAAATSAAAVTAAARKDDDFTFSDTGLQELRHYAGGAHAGGAHAGGGWECGAGGVRCGRARCVRCGRAAAGGAVCGSDGRSYPSLCRLDLHNCMRGPERGAVRLACAGECPCADCAQLPARLLAWFRVLRAGGGAGGGGNGVGGAEDARWMFSRLDADADGRLTRHETRTLRRDRRERCVPGLLAQCARGPGGVIRRRDWTDCLHVRDELSDDEDTAGSGDDNLLE